MFYRRVKTRHVCVRRRLEDLPLTHDVCLARKYKKKHTSTRLCSLDVVMSKEGVANEHVTKGPVGCDMGLAESVIPRTRVE